MKNYFKMMGIIAITAMIGFGFVACDTDDGNNNNNNNNNNNGDNTGSVTEVDKYADAIKAQGADFAEKSKWVKDNAVAGGVYAIEIPSDVSLGAQVFEITPAAANKSISSARAAASNDVTIVLRKTGASAVIDLSENTGILFHLKKGTTLVLDNGVTLRGKTTNNQPLVKVDGGNTLTMENGSVIKDNYRASTNGGGGVFIDGGTFIMNGGTITNCKSNRGGGVSVWAGSFTMNGGTIEKCSAGGTGYSTSSVGGGGVYVHGNPYYPESDGTFTMNGGLITENSIGGTDQGGSGGGGVSNSGIFNMKGGTISKNTATDSQGNSGGGVASSRTFNMTGGTISANKAGYGGGVYNLFEGGVLNKTGGTIYGGDAGENSNTATKTFDKGGVTGIHHGDTVSSYYSGYKYYLNETSTGKIYQDKRNADTIVGLNAVN